MGKQYVMNTTTSAEVKTKLFEILEETQEEYKKAEQLLQLLRADNNWKAPKSKNELLAILDLVQQFHKDFCMGDNSPLLLYANSFYALINGVEGYSVNSNSYRELNSK